MQNVFIFAKKTVIRRKIKTLSSTEIYGPNLYDYEIVNGSQYFLGQFFIAISKK